MNLLLSLLLGIVLITIANGLLVRLARTAPPLAAILTALTTLLLMVPSVVMFQPGVDVVAIQLTAFLLANLMCGLFWQARARGETLSARGHLGPRVIIGFFIGLATVDSVFVVVAERGIPAHLASALLPEPRGGEVAKLSFPGVVADNYQKKEALYNEFLEQQRLQEQRGWQVRKGWLRGEPEAGAEAIFQVEVTTREGIPLRDVTASGTFAWSGGSDRDTPFSMEEVTPGRYQVPLSLPTPGHWRLLMNLEHQGEVHEIRASTTVAVPAS